MISKRNALTGFFLLAALGCGQGASFTALGTKTPEEKKTLLFGDGLDRAGAREE